MSKRILIFIALSGLLLSGIVAMKSTDTNEMGLGADTTDATIQKIEEAQVDSVKDGTYTQVIRGGIYDEAETKQIADLPDNVEINVRHGGADGDGYQIIIYEEGRVISKGYGSMIGETWIKSITASSTK